MRGLLTPVVALTVLWPALVGARARVARPRLEQRKEAAYAAFERGSYSKAIREFEAIRHAGGDDRLLYNIGLAYYRRYEVKGSARDLRRARDSFRRFVTEIRTPAASAPDRLKVQRAKRYARRFLQLIDSLSSEAASQPSSRPASKPVSALATSLRAPLYVDSSQSSSSARPERSAGGKRRWLHWLLYGVAGAAGAAAAVTGGLALRADGRSDELAGRGDPQANQEASRSRGLALSSDLLLGSALVSATVGLVLHLRD